MDKIIPEGMEVVPASAEIKITKTVETGLVAKAKELLTVPMDSSDLMNALEYYCVYGRAPEMKGDKPQVDGENIKVEAGHKSKHYTSSQLKRIIATVKADLTPKEELIEEVEPIEEVIK